MEEKSEESDRYSVVNSSDEERPHFGAQLTEHVVQKITRPPSRDGHADNRSETSQGTVVPDGKFSMIEFAVLHFRETLEKFEMLRVEDGSIQGTIKKTESLKLLSVQKHEQNRHGGSNDWSWKEQADLVKWTRSPIQASLLNLQNPEMNKMALECFLYIMKYMGDYPLGSGETENDCALKILKMCHKYPEIRDEVYCQLAKQTTSNRSMKPKSAIMGWRLFSIVGAYCDCSEVLRPYFFKYLETTASDPSRTHSGAAAICLQNLRKTFKYGGRKNVPLAEELSALADGRISKRFSFIYSGSEREGMLHVRPCMVVHDAIEDVCSRLQIHDPVEVEEYTMFLRTAGGIFTRLRSDEYILDVTAELLRARQEYDLVFQRTVWYFPFRSIENVLYNELMYSQCIPDYKEGLLVTMRDGVLTKQYEMDISLLAALLHRAADQVAMPTNKDLEHLLPDLVRKMPDYRPQQWLNRVHDQMGNIGRMSSVESMARFVEVLSRWPLFGSTFFRVKKVLTQPPFGHCILAVNKTGVLLLDPTTHDTFLAYTFTEVLSTRRYRSDSNQNYLDMKLGNLMVQKIVRIETDQGSDISNLISQYMQVINRHRKRPSEKMLTPRT